MREKIVRKLAERNTVLTPEAWDYLDRLDDPTSAIDKIMREMDDLPFPICRDDLFSLVQTHCDIDDEWKEEQEELEQSESIEEETDRNVERIDSNVEILKDISGNSTCTGVIEDFKRYFNDRFERLSSIIKERGNSRGSTSIRRLKEGGGRDRNGEAKVIGMVRDIHNTRNGNKIMTIEDDTDKIRGFISQDSQADNKRLLEDEVVLAIGSVWEKKKNYDQTFAIKDIVRPGVPKIGNEDNPDFPGKIAFIGDVHVGSDEFLESSWDRFVSWMNSNREAEEINYLVIMGDIVEGIGVYPNQEEELTIIDINEQYKKAADMLSDLPEGLEVIAIPGNHDVVRNAEPQPALPEETRALFPDNIRFTGNPSLVEIEGLKLLLYHGSSINDLSDIHPDVTSDRPITAMKEMLKRRHLVPVYGKKTGIAPEEEDHLVIDEVPDIFVTGHIHRTEVDQYHGTILVNSSAWQGQTEYQKMRDIQPDPGKVVVVDPSENKVSIQTFE